MSTESAIGPRDTCKLLVALIPLIAALVVGCTRDVAPAEQTFAPSASEIHSGTGEPDFRSVQAELQEWGWTVTSGGTRIVGGIVVNRSSTAVSGHVLFNLYDGHGRYVGEASGLVYDIQPGGTRRFGAIAADAGAVVAELKGFQPGDRVTGGSGNPIGNGTRKGALTLRSWSVGEGAGPGDTISGTAVNESGVRLVNVIARFSLRDGSGWTQVLSDWREDMQPGDVWKFEISLAGLPESLVELQTLTGDIPG